jgi:hypothetical protein
MLNCTKGVMLLDPKKEKIKKVIGAAILFLFTTGLLFWVVWLYILQWVIK